MYLYQCKFNLFYCSVELYLQSRLQLTTSRYVDIEVKAVFALIGQERQEALEVGEAPPWVL